MTHTMTENLRAWMLVAVTVLIVAMTLAWVSTAEQDPCQAWLDRHGEPHARCLAP
jgi:hypothetical protein